MDAGKDIQDSVAFYADKYLPGPSRWEVLWVSVSDRLCCTVRTSVLEAALDFRRIQTTTLT